MAWQCMCKHEDWFVRISYGSVFQGVVYKISGFLIDGFSTIESSVKSDSNKRIAFDIDIIIVGRRDMGIKSFHASLSVNPIVIAANEDFLDTLAEIFIKIVLDIYVLFFLSAVADVADNEYILQLWLHGV